MVKLCCWHKIFSLICSKLNVRGRLKKSEKELMLEEIGVFDNLLKDFAINIKDNVVSKNYCINTEKELYKYGFDVLYFEVFEDVFKDKIIKLNVRCERKDIKSVLIPIISKSMKQNFDVVKIIDNDVFGYYEITLKVSDIVSFNFGVGQKAMDGQFCGDSYLVYKNEQKQVFALSDGMGIGKEAKKRSKLALDLLQKFMDVGIEEKQAINSINCILKNESNKESYTTLDLFVYDKFRNEFYFSKNGACNSFVVSKKGISVINGDNLPIGIMDRIEFKENKVNLNDGDYVIMVSDGVSEQKLSFLNKIKSNNPQKMVGELLNCIKDSNDDETIMIIKIKK